MLKLLKPHILSSDSSSSIGDFFRRGGRFEEVESKRSHESHGKDGNRGWSSNAVSPTPQKPILRVTHPTLTSLIFCNIV